MAEVASEILSSGPVRFQVAARLSVATTGAGFTDLTRAVLGVVEQAKLRDGLVTLACLHTSASLTIQENADPDVRADLMAALERLAPRAAAYSHSAEGPDDMPAHIRTVLTGSCLSVPILAGRLCLGTWQAIYLIEHRDRPHRREVVVQMVGS